MKKGFVALIGAGPGDAGLLTLRGKDLLDIADVVVYDRLVSKDVLNMIPQNARKINVGKKSSNHLIPQEEINKILLNEALKGNRVVRLKGGDPYVFGRGGEELELIEKHNIPFEVVPGITSAIAVPSFAGIPVTHRDYCSSLHIITGHKKKNLPLDIDFDALVRTKGTLVFLMSVASLEDIINGLIDAGANKDTSVAIIENGTTPNQRKIVSNLDNICVDAKDYKIKSPAIIVVGDVSSLANDYDWFSNRPLFGRTIIVTRPVESKGTLSKKLRILGAEVFEFPCIKIEELLDKEKLNEAIRKINEYSWLVFTSKNGVRIFFATLSSHNLDSRILGNIKIAVVGSQTARELNKYGLRADLIPEVFDGHHLGEELAQITTNQDNILLLRAENGSEDITNILESFERKYKDVGLYKTVNISDYVDEIEKNISTRDKLYVTFTSASTVEGFVSNIKTESLSKITGVCIGNQTAKKADEYNINYIVSESATIDSMITRLLEVK